MSTIRDYVNSQLIEPLKNYPTTIQDTLLSIIADRLEELYEYTKKFPEIISPNATRLDIIKAIVEQFKFNIRDEADIYEQVSILDNILYLYNKRGSIETIENMWKYYGGDLPKEIKVEVPSYKFFRHSMSTFSGSHVYPDDNIKIPGVYELESNDYTYISGVYEVVLYNSNYPINKLKEFMLKELVAAGNKIYFTNNIYSILTDSQASYSYNIYDNTFIDRELDVISYRSGLVLSGLGMFSRNTEFSLWSGRPDLFLEIIISRDLEHALLGLYELYDGIFIQKEKTETAHYYMKISAENKLNSLELLVHCTPEEESFLIERYLYDKDGELVSSSFPGYFVLGETLLGSEVL